MFFSKKMIVANMVYSDKNTGKNQERYERSLRARGRLTIKAITGEKTKAKSWVP